ncbi:uncharacterized protein LOC143298008 [Babylonia areolata]|uniref:uncharacterized protein LOC143298008 n=1 Tax=Babylonia areolata TaxID=304850 RepID=UPI003FCFDD78
MECSQDMLFQFLLRQAAAVVKSGVLFRQGYLQHLLDLFSVPALAEKKRPEGRQGLTQSSPPLVPPPCPGTEKDNSCDHSVTSSFETASKRRKKPPRRRNETHTEVTSGSGGENPLTKIINSSRFVKTLVDNINSCLYDSHKQSHQHHPQPTTTTAATTTPATTVSDSKPRAAAAAAAVAPESQPVPSTSAALLNDSSSLLEEFDFLNKDMTQDTVSNIINTASGDPIFQELFDIFNTDRDEFRKKLSEKGSCSHQKTASPEGLHTPPHCSGVEADFAPTGFMMPLTMASSLSSSLSQHPTVPNKSTTTTTTSVPRSHLATLTFSTECLDLNSMSGFPIISDSSEDQGTAVTSGDQPGVQRSLGQDSPGVQPGVHRTLGQDSSSDQSGVQRTSGQDSSGVQPGVHRTLGQDSTGDQPGVQRTSGQDSPGVQPVVHSTLGQDSSSDQSGVQRTSGQDSSGVQPGVHRTLGQDLSSDQSGVQRTSGQDSSGVQPGVHRSLGQDSIGVQQEVHRTLGPDCSSDQPGVKRTLGQGSSVDQTCVHSTLGQDSSGDQPGVHRTLGQGSSGDQEGAHRTSGQDLCLPGNVETVSSSDVTEVHQGVSCTTSQVESVPMETECVHEEGRIRHCQDQREKRCPEKEPEKVCDSAQVCEIAQNSATCESVEVNSVPVLSSPVQTSEEQKACGAGSDYVEVSPKPRDMCEESVATQETKTCNVLSSSARSKTPAAAVMGTSSGVTSTGARSFFLSEHSYCQGDGKVPVQSRVPDLREESTISASSFPGTPEVSDSVPVSPQRSRWGRLALAAGSEETSSDSRGFFDGTLQGAVVIRDDSGHRPQSARQEVTSSPRVLVDQTGPLTSTASSEKPGIGLVPCPISGQLGSTAVTTSLPTVVSIVSGQHGSTAVTTSPPSDVSIVSGQHGSTAVTTSPPSDVSIACGQQDSTAVTTSPPSDVSIVSGHQDSTAITTSPPSDVSIVSGHQDSTAVMTSPPSDVSIVSGQHSSTAVTTSLPSDVSIVSSHQGSTAVPTSLPSVVALCSSALTSHKVAGLSCVAPASAILQALSFQAGSYSLQTTTSTSHVMTLHMSSGNSSLPSRLSPLGKIQESENSPQRAQVRSLCTVQGQRSPLNELSPHGRVQASSNEVTLVSADKVSLTATLPSVKTHHHLSDTPVFVLSSPVKSGLMISGHGKEASSHPKVPSEVSCSTPLGRLGRVPTEPPRQSQIMSPHSVRQLKEVLTQNNQTEGTQTDQTKRTSKCLVLKETETTENPSSQRHLVVTTVGNTASERTAESLTHSVKVTEHQLVGCVEQRDDFVPLDTVKAGRTGDFPGDPASSHGSVPQAVTLTARRGRVQTPEKRFSGSKSSLGSKSVTLNKTDENEGFVHKSYFVSKKLQYLRQKMKTQKKHRVTVETCCTKPSNISTSLPESVCEETDRQKHLSVSGDLQTLQSSKDHDQSAVQASPGHSGKQNTDSDRTRGNPALPHSSKSSSSVPSSHRHLQSPGTIQPPSTPPRPGTSVFDSVFQTPPRNSVGTSRSTTPRTPRRSNPGTPRSAYPRTPPRSVRGTPIYSPIKSPYSPGTAAAINSLFSPRRKRILNEPIPEEVFEEISRHSDSDVQSVSRPGSVCSTPVQVEENEEVGLDSSSAFHQIQTFTSATEGNGSTPRVENHVSFDNHLAGPPFHGTGCDKEQTPPGPSGCSDSSHSALDKGTASLARAVGSALDSAREKQSVGRKKKTVISSVESQDRVRSEQGEVEGTSPHTSSSSGLNHFRVVGVVEAESDLPKPHPLTTRTVPKQRQGPLISVGEMVAATDGSPRHSASIFSSHVTVQLSGPAVDGDRSAGKGEGSEDSARRDADKELSSGDVFISPGVSEEVNKTNISWPILPLAVSQFLDNQIEMGELHVPTDLTNDLKTPTASPEKKTPRKRTPRRSPRKSSQQQLSMQIGQFASLSRRKDKSPKKAVSRLFLTSEEQECPRKRRRLLRNSETCHEKNPQQQLRHFASVSEENSTELEGAEFDHSSWKTRAKSEGGTRAPSKPRDVSKKTSVSPPKPQVKRSKKSTSKKRRVRKRAASPKSPVSDSFSIHSCTSSESKSFSSEDDVPLSEIVKKAAQKKSAVSCVDDVPSYEEIKKTAQSQSKTPFSSDDDMPLNDQVKKLAQKESASFSSAGSLKTRPSDELQQARQDSLTPKEAQESPCYDTDESYGSRNIATLKSAVLDGNLDTIIEEGHSSAVAEMPRDVVLTEKSADQAPVSMSVSLAANPNMTYLPFKKRPVGRKNLSLLRYEPSSDDEENASVATMAKPSQTNPVNVDMETIAGQVENGNSALSRASHSGSSSVEVDICELSEENTDKEDFPTLQSIRKRRAILAVKKKSAGKQKNPAHSKAGSSENLEKQASPRSSQEKKSSPSSSSSKKKSHKKDRLKLQKKSAAASSAGTAANTACEGVLAKHDDTTIPKPGDHIGEIAKVSKTPDCTLLEPQQKDVPGSGGKEQTLPDDAASSAAVSGPSDSVPTLASVKEPVAGGGGLGQQNQRYCYTAVQQPEVVGIQQYGPYRRIKPTLISKTTTSYFPSIKRGQTQAGLSLYETESVASTGFSVFSAPSPMTPYSEMSSGILSSVCQPRPPWPQASVPQPSLQRGVSAGSSVVQGSSAPNMPTQTVTSKTPTRREETQVSSASKGFTFSGSVLQAADIAHSDATTVPTSAKDSSSTCEKSDSGTAVAKKSDLKGKSARILQVDSKQQNVCEAHSDTSGEKPAHKSSGHRGSHRTAVRKLQSKKPVSKRITNILCGGSDQNTAEEVQTNIVTQKCTENMSDMVGRTLVSKRPSRTKLSAGDADQNAAASDVIAHNTRQKPGADPSGVGVESRHGSQTGCGLHVVDTSIKPAKDSSAVCDALGTGLSGKEKSGLRIKAGQRTRKNTKKDCTNSATDKKKRSLQKPAKGKSRGVREASQTLPKHDPQPPPTEEPNVETGPAGSQQACDSFETDEAVKALEGLDASGREEEGELAYVKSHQEPVEGERDQEAETSPGLQDQTPEQGREDTFADEFHLPDLTPSPPEQLPCSTPRRKRRLSSPVSVPSKKIRTESMRDKDKGSPGESDTLVNQLSAEEPTSPHKKTPEINEGSDQTSGFLSMPFLGEISRSPVKLSGMALRLPNHTSEPDHVIHIEEERPGDNTVQTGTSEADDANILSIDGSSIMNQFSTLLNKLEGEEQNGVGVRVRVVASAAYAHNTQPATSSNGIAPEGTGQAGDDFGWHTGHPPDGTPEPQHSQTAPLQPEHPQQSSAGSRHLQLEQELKQMRIAKYQARTQKRREQRMKNGEHVKESKRRKKMLLNSSIQNSVSGPPQMQVAGQNFVPGLTQGQVVGMALNVPTALTSVVSPLHSLQDGKYRPILPKIDTHMPVPRSGRKYQHQAILPTAWLSAPSTSGSRSKRGTAGLNPLDAAMLSVLPELAANQNMDAHLLQLVPASETEQVVPEREQDGHTQDNDGCVQSQEVITMNRRTEGIREGDVSDMASPQPLVIDDTFASGPESSPYHQTGNQTVQKLPANGNKKEVPQKGKASKQARKKPEQKVTKVGKGSGRSQQKPVGGRNKAPKKLLPAFDSVSGNLGQQQIGERSQQQGRTDVGASPGVNPQPVLSAQQMFQQMMQPAVSQAVSVSESDGEIGLLDHDALTDLVPVSMLPPIMSESENTEPQPSLPNPLYVQSSPGKTVREHSSSQAVPGSLEPVNVAASFPALAASLSLKPSVGTGSLVPIQPETEPAQSVPLPASQADPETTAAADTVQPSPQGSAVVLQPAVVPVVSTASLVPLSTVVPAQGQPSSGPSQQLHAPSTQPASPQAVTSLKPKSQQGRKSPALSRGFESPRQEIAQILVSMDIIDTKKKAAEGQGGAPAEQNARTSGSAAECSGKMGRLDSINIDSFLKKVHK